MNEFLRSILFLPPQASTIAISLDGLHYFVILTTMGGAIAITLVGGYFLFKYRRADGEEPPREQPVPSVPIWLEVSVITFLFGLFITWWAIGFSQYVRIRVAPKNTFDIYVTAKQWMWKFAYPDGSHTITKVYVPSGRPVKLIMTSRDVIHSFYVPDFRLKQDVIPGRYTTLWFQTRHPGTYQVLCAEYCGTNHSTMRGEVVALSPEDYARWLSGNQPGAELAGPRPQDPSVVDDFPPRQELSLVRVGVQAAAQQGCLRCHTLDGTPHIGPTWAGLWGSKVELSDGRTVTADDAYLTQSMMDPAAMIVRGYQPVMPSYRGLLQPGETAAILELIKSIKDVPPHAPLGTPPPSQQGLPIPGVTPEPAPRGTLQITTPEGKYEVKP